MSQTNQKEIERIDKVLDQLDELMKQLPNDYQMDYAHEVLGRFEEE